MSIVQYFIYVEYNQCIQFWNRNHKDRKGSIKEKAHKIDTF